MRTTIRIDDQLLAQAKQLGARTGRTLTAVIEDALREVLSRQRRLGRRTLELTTVAGNGPRPGVDLDDSAALMDRADAAD